MRETIMEAMADEDERQGAKIMIDALSAPCSWLLYQCWYWKGLVLAKVILCRKGLDTVGTSGVLQRWSVVC
jgi:hypothetical protein